MNLIVFGASGGVGRCLVEQALAMGAYVTAAVRTPAAMTLRHERLSIEPCDATDPVAVLRAVAGHDAVFSALGDKSRGPTSLYSVAARNITGAMREHGVRRLLFLSNFGVEDERAQGLQQGILLFLARPFLRHTLADHRRAIEEMRRSRLLWTAIRPLPLKNGPATGRYRVTVDGLPPNGTGISRADVADFMLRQATSEEYLNQVPAIAY